MERRRKGGDVGMAFLPEIRVRRQAFLPWQRIWDPDSGLTSKHSPGSPRFTAVMDAARLCQTTGLR